VAVLYRIQKYYFENGASASNIRTYSCSGLQQWFRTGAGELCRRTASSISVFRPTVVCQRPLCICEKRLLRPGFSRRLPALGSDQYNWSPYREVSGCISAGFVMLSTSTKRLSPWTQSKPEVFFYLFYNIVRKAPISFVMFVYLQVPVPELRVHFVRTRYGRPTLKFV
jgi:hypothetical protein